MPRKKGPWTVLNSRIAYKNAWMTVQEDRVISPAGKPSIYGTIALKAGVNIIPIDESLNVYLAEEYHYGIDKTTIEAVGGGIEKGQSPLQAAKRELMEEAGLKARTWTALGKSNSFTSFLNSPSHLYMAEGLTHGLSALEDGEVIQIVKMPLKRALRLIDKGIIDHAATMVALLKIAALKKIR